MQQVNSDTPNDPAPSRWSYRFQRLMLTPLFRKVLRVGIPFCLTFAIAAGYLSDRDRQDSIRLAVADFRHQIETRPEFMINLLAIEGASPSIEEDIREIFPFDLPASSFDLDLESVREMIVGLPAVADADVRVRQGGVLVAEVSEREPVVVWRSHDGLALVDIEGVVTDELDARSERFDLPAIAGAGGNQDVPGAIAILEAAAPIKANVLGLVRIGERRWDLVLKEGQRILLPEENPVRALERVIVLSQVQDMLERDIVVVDMRLSDRPTLRMNERAVEDWWRVTKLTVGAQQQ